MLGGHDRDSRDDRVLEDVILVGPDSYPVVEPGSQEHEAEGHEERQHRAESDVEGRVGLRRFERLSGCLVDRDLRLGLAPAELLVHALDEHRRIRVGKALGARRAAVLGAYLE